MELTTRFTNCYLLRNHELVLDDLWVRGNRIINPESNFYSGKFLNHKIVDCQQAIISPGFIDVQINGGFGIDFSYDIEKVSESLLTVGKGILAHGVTSFCPTLVSSRPEVYHKVLPHLRKKDGGSHGAEVLGAHVEGPFISKEKRGAHDVAVLQTPLNGIKSVLEMYGSLDSIAIITLAPELEKVIPLIKQLSESGIIVSLGHSMASISTGEQAVQNGASFITHLFNAMLPFHHRDPGLVGLLASDQIPQNKVIYYGLIADGNHTHPSTTRIAYRAYKKGCVLVTDACSAMGLTDGAHHIGQQSITVEGTRAVIEGTNTLCGSVATMPSCINYFWKTTGSSLVEALEAATLHPARLMGIEYKKGTLDYDTDADFVLLHSQSLNVISTWILGKCVYSAN